MVADTNIHSDWLPGLLRRTDQGPVRAAKCWVGWLPGGLGVATVFSTAGFAAVSGASVATSAVFARIAIPEMLKIGYDKRFAAGVVAAGGTLASLIPLLQFWLSTRLSWSRMLAPC
nr:TRAP transporter large permease subunit [Aliamphritea spongicola]